MRRHDLRLTTTRLRRLVVPGSGNGALANVTLDTIFEGQAIEVQQRSTATLPPNTDLIRPTKPYELHQRPASTSMQLVHTEEVGEVTAKTAWRSAPDPSSAGFNNSQPSPMRP